MKFVGFDLETTGLDVYADRIVTASIVLYDEELGILEDKSWLLQTDMKIPERATEVHGITTEDSKANGVVRAQGVLEIAQTVRRLSEEENAPVVIYNAPYDLTLLKSQLAEFGFDTLKGWAPIVIDPFVIDKGIDPYRKGKRTLTVTAEHYGVVVKNAHEARADVLMALGVVKALKVLPKLIRYFNRPSDLQDLYRQQKAWKQEQNSSFREYCMRLGQREKALGIFDGWPVYLSKHNPANAQSLAQPSVGLEN